MKATNTLIDLILFCFVLFSSIVMKVVRRVGLEKLPISKFILLKIGVLPIRNHYYEPQFIYSREQVKFINKRILKGIDLNVEFQLEFLKKFEKLNLGKELTDLSFGEKKVSSHVNDLIFQFDNGSFESGDAEIYYNLIRTIKPSQIIEIGSGNSTLIALQAIGKNIIESGKACYVSCIEPYEMKWLERTQANVIREKVEAIDLNTFQKLNENDILFIDSSHIIRPVGDVVFNFLSILPSLNKGVYVHIHDIFTPQNYPTAWIEEKCLLWNEQFMLEAFLTNNDSFRVVCAVNYLNHNHYEELKKIAPFTLKSREPGSFWIQKIK
jgi:hypothetical protein